MNTLILAFDTQYYNLEELQQMTPAQLYELAATDKTTGADTAEISTPEEFQELFNTGCVDHKFSYIFLIKDPNK